MRRRRGGFGRFGRRIRKVFRRMRGKFRGRGRRTGRSALLSKSGGISL